MTEQPHAQPDYIFRGRLAELDPEMARVLELEQQRQFAKLIMIASESAAPAAIREIDGGVLRNIYAEGYPHERMHDEDEAQLLDMDQQMPFFRRMGDRRYYKGVEFCNVVEALAQRRCAEVFCPPGMTPAQLHVNVQSLSGAVANTAVYQAMLQPGDTVLALDLMHGGHLSHGSPVNVTGMRQRIVTYHVNEENELLDYEEIHELAMREKPKMIIAGYTSYPYAPDFAKFRAIADECGAFLLADIAHTAGLAAVGAYPNPVGIAQITTFTTHKTLAGPRGAVIITTDPDLAKKIDRAVFPGLQGGTNMSKVAATATMFKLAQTDQFRDLQFQVCKNAVALSEGFKANGLRVVHGGTNTHMVLLDCKPIANFKGEPLMGDVASRILDLAGIVCNRNTIPGDKDASRPSALRFGTTWATQRGLRKDDMREIAGIVASVLKTAKPYALKLKNGSLPRAKVDFDALLAGAQRARALAATAGADGERKPYTYPYVWDAPALEDTGRPSPARALEIAGDKAGEFMDAVLAQPVSGIDAGERVETQVLGRNRVPLCDASVVNTGNGFLLVVNDAQAGRAAQWLRALSDNCVIFDDADPARSAPGPVAVIEWGAAKA